MISKTHFTRDIQMDKLTNKLFWLLHIICLLNIINVHGFFFKFTNITCESKDNSLGTVDYCRIVQVNRSTNYMSLRYMLLQPIQKDISFHLNFMINRNNGWKTFLYDIDIDMCRFWKSRYNAIAKLIFGFLDDHTNLNHSCPYTEKFLAVDKVLNTDVTKRLRGIPLETGSYALFTKWSWKNVTRAETNIYVEVLK